MTEKQKPAPLQEWQRDAIAAEPPNFMRDVVRDAFNGISQSASMIPDRQRSEDKPRIPSSGTVEVKPPPGIEIIDAMCTEQSRIVRLAAIKQRIENAWIEQLMSKKTDEVATDYNPFDREHMSK